MPAGDLVVADFQVELNLVLMGAGTNYELGPGPITGLGQPPAKVQDVTLSHEPGAYGAKEFTDVRTLSIPLLIHGTDPADAMTNFATVSAAWAASETDVELWIQLPGFGKFHVVGRPREFADDLTNLKSSEIAALGTFVALDPTLVF